MGAAFGLARGDDGEFFPSCACSFCHRGLSFSSPKALGAGLLPLREMRKLSARLLTAAEPVILKVFLSATQVTSEAFCWLWLLCEAEQKRFALGPFLEYC